MRRVAHLLVPAILAGILAVHPAGAAILQVAASAPDVLATDGTCSLREAIINTNDDAATWPDCAAGSGADRINLRAGTYVLAIPGTDEDAAASGDLDVLDDLTLVGAGAGLTTIDAAGLDSALHVADGAVVDIGRIRVSGGIFIFPTILNEGDLTLSAVVVSDSSIGIHNLVGELTVEASTISGDLLGIAIQGQEYVDCGRYSCWCEGCGENAPVRLVNTTVKGIFAGWFFTPDCGCGGPVTLVGSTLTDGQVGGNSYSIHGVLSVFTAGTIFANSCLVAALFSEGHNLDSDGTCNLTAPTDLPNTDPMLGALQDNGGPTPTHALLPGSPAIDAIPVVDCTYDDDGDPGTPAVPLADDQRGVARPQGDGCDIGAYEVTACADGINNDTDAFTDLDDPGCRDAASVREDPQCQDGINNDPGQDSLIDFDGGLSVLGYVATDPDPQCVGKPWSDREARPYYVCGPSAELALLLAPPLWVWRRRKAFAG